MGRALKKSSRAEELSRLHDELDALEKRESYAVLGGILLVAAAVLLVVGIVRGSLSLEMNGFFTAIAGIVLGGVEVSRARRIRGLEGRIAHLEESAGGRAGEEQTLGRPPEG